ITFLLFFSWSSDPRDLPSFPTRRSSDLAADRSRTPGRATWARQLSCQNGAGGAASSRPPQRRRRAQMSKRARDRRPNDRGRPGRSEEHTSELQSPCNLVCRLLLEKKNKH